MKWKDIPGYEGLYQVSDGGQVRSKKRKKILSPCTGKDGYLYLTLYQKGKRKTISVHKIVRMAFIGKIQKGYQVNHINGVKTDNDLSNLEVLSKTEHDLRTREQGLNLGSNHGNSSITEETAKLIVDKLALPEYQKYGGLTKIAKELGISKDIVYNIKYRGGWSHVKKERWKNIPGYEGLYQVSDQGSIRTMKRTWYSGPELRIARQVKPKLKAVQPDKNGYMRVTLSKKGKKRRVSVHTLVLNTFVGPAPAGQECRHLDDDKSNNKLTNLCWGTPKENAADRKKHGRQTGGKAGVRKVGKISRKFTPEQWERVEQLFKQFDFENLPEEEPSTYFKRRHGEKI